MQLINPLFPLFLETTGATGSEISYVISAGSLAATLLMFPSGIIVDRFGKRLFLLLNAILSTGSIYMISRLSDWKIILQFYVIYSLVGAFFVPARMSMISENASTDNRAALFGFMNMAWPITGIISPVISGWIVEASSWASVYHVATLVSLISILPAYLITEKAQVKGESVKIPHLSDLLQRDTLRVLIVMSIAPFLMTTAIGAVNLVLPIYLSSAYHLSPLLIGLFFTASNVFTLFTQIPSGRLADRYDPKKILLICTLAIPPFFILWYFSDNWLIFLAAYSVALGLWSVTWPSNLTTLSTKIPPELQGAGFGINSTGLRLGFTVGPLIGSFLYEEMFPTAPFLFAALSTLLALPIISLLKRLIQLRAYECFQLHFRATDTMDTRRGLAFPRECTRVCSSFGRR